VPEFETVPVIAILGIEVVVDPLIVLDAPLKVYTPVIGVKVVALLVKLPPKLKELALFVSFQTAPLFKVTSPVNE
jgi:hypothetical protein